MTPFGILSYFEVEGIFLKYKCYFFIKKPTIYTHFNSIDNRKVPTDLTLPVDVALLGPRDVHLPAFCHWDLTGREVYKMERRPFSVNLPHWQRQGWEWEWGMLWKSSWLVCSKRTDDHTVDLVSLYMIRIYCYTLFPKIAPNCVLATSAVIAIQSPEYCHCCNIWHLFWPWLHCIHTIWGYRDSVFQKALVPKTAMRSHWRWFPVCPQLNRGQTWQFPA